LKALLLPWLFTTAAIFSTNKIIAEEKTRENRSIIYKKMGKMPVMLGN
jgi:hypothetical protein